MQWSHTHVNLWYSFNQCEIVEVFGYIGSNIHMHIYMGIGAIKQIIKTGKTY